MNWHRTVNDKWRVSALAIGEGEPRALEVADLRWVEPAKLNGFNFPPADAELIAMLSGGSLMARRNA